MLRHQYPDNPVLHDLSDETRLVVSEPLGDLKGAWRSRGDLHPAGGAAAVHAAGPVRPLTGGPLDTRAAGRGVVGGGHDELRPFTPTPTQTG